MRNDLPDIADPTRPLAALAACPVHAATPLVALDRLASQLGWTSLHAKDESGRMGLGSFKALGGAYAVMTLVRERLTEALGRVPEHGELPDLKDHPSLEGMVVCCASAGNHGLSVAAGAQVFGIGCEIVLAETVPASFAGRLKAKGATVLRAGAVYEEAMTEAKARAERPGAVLVSDMATAHDMTVPSRVMQGYAVMADEIHAAFERQGTFPDTVALQAGVGGLAATIAAHIRRTWPSQPRIIVVEPDRAACLGASVAAGEAARANGPMSDMVSNMGRLDCKEPSQRGFQVLREAADEFVTVSDEAAARAVERLAAHGLETTPSGAAGLAGMIEHAPKGSRVLVLVTEGAVD